MLQKMIHDCPSAVGGGARSPDLPVSLGVKTGCSAAADAGSNAKHDLSTKPKKILAQST